MADRGRPSDYTPEIAATICEKMAAGMTLLDICRQEDMPSRTSVYRWTEANEEFRAMYARARVALVELWADEIIQISDDTAKDTHTTVYEDGAERVSPNTEWISRSRLRVDTRKWLASKIAPKLYGERLETHTTHAVDGSVAALLAEIDAKGKRIQDK